MNISHLILGTMCIATTAVAAAVWSAPADTTVLTADYADTAGPLPSHANFPSVTEYVLTPRSVFSTVAAAVVQQHPAAATVVAAPTASEIKSPTMILLGIVGSDGRQQALFRLQSGKIASYRANEVVDEWRILSISDGRVDIQKDQKQLYWSLDRAHTKIENTGWMDNLSAKELSRK